MDQGPPWESPQWESYDACCPWEGYSVCPGIIQGVGGGAPPISLGHPVMGLPMGGQGPCCQLHIAPGSVEPLEEPLPVVVPPPCHPEAVGLRRVDPKCVARLTSHAHHIGHICAVKEFRQGCEGPL